jgi:hypothetical protein
MVYIASNCIISSTEESDCSISLVLEHYEPNELDASIQIHGLDIPNIIDIKDGYMIINNESYNNVGYFDLPIHLLITSIMILGFSIVIIKIIYRYKT